MLDILPTLDGYLNSIATFQVDCLIKKERAHLVTVRMIDTLYKKLGGKSIGVTIGAEGMKLRVSIRLKIQHFSVTGFTLSNLKRGRAQMEHQNQPHQAESEIKKSRFSEEGGTGGTGPHHF